MSPLITVAPVLDARWRPVIERQFDLMLAPVRHELQNPRIRFEQADPGRGPTDEACRYFCELTARLHRGERLKIALLHTDGRVAIKEVLYRARRAVGRQHLMGMTPFSRRGALAPTR